MFKKGDVVRVRESALRDGAAYSGHNRQLVANYGWLYLVERKRRDTIGAYSCKSLATGGTINMYGDPITWNDDEIIKAGES